LAAVLLIKFEIVRQNRNYVIKINEIIGGEANKQTIASLPLWNRKLFPKCSYLYLQPDLF